jgi:hypothetical protein
MGRPCPIKCNSSKPNKITHSHAEECTGIDKLENFSCQQPTAAMGIKGWIMNDNEKN